MIINKAREKSVILKPIRKGTDLVIKPNKYTGTARIKPAKRKWMNIATTRYTWLNQEASPLLRERLIPVAAMALAMIKIINHEPKVFRSGKRDEIKLDIVSDDFREVGLN